MDFSVTHEAYVFFISVLSGIGIGLLYDCLRTIRRCSGASSAITDVEDVIFWVVSVALMFFAVLLSNNGELRWYQFLGCFLGSILYFFTLSRAFCFLVRKIIEIFSKIFAFFCKILLTPLLFTYKLLYRSILFIFVPFFRMCKKMKRNIFRSFLSGIQKTKNIFMKK